MQIELSKKDLDTLVKEVSKDIQAKVLERSMDASVWETLKQRGINYAKTFLGDSAVKDGMHEYLKSMVEKMGEERLREMIRREVSNVMTDETFRKTIHQYVLACVIERAESLKRLLEE